MNAVKVGKWSCVMTQQRCFAMGQVVILSITQTSMAEQRVAIFGDWRIEEPSLERERAVRVIPRSDDARRADDLIHTAQLLTANIQGFLQAKHDYQQRWRTARERLAELLDALHQLCNDQKEESSEYEGCVELFKETLRRLFTRLREAKTLQNRIAKYFLGANLANYDPRNQKLSFPRSKEELTEELHQRLAELASTSVRVRETLQLRESSIELSNLFGREESFEMQIERLGELLSHDRLVSVHYLMLFQLEEVHCWMEEQVGTYCRVAEDEFHKYEVVLDSLMLMGEEMEEMAQQSEEMRGDILRVTREGQAVDPQEMQRETKEKLAAATHNIRVYEANLNNFVRVNAETNMHYYYLQKARFMTSLRQFRQTTGQHHTHMGQVNAVNALHHGYVVAQRRIDLTGRVENTDRKQLLSLYQQCNQMENSSHPQVADYRQNVLEEMAGLMDKHGIPHQPHVHPKDDLEAALRKEISFFRQLNAQPPHKQYELIRREAVQVQVCLYELPVIIETYSHNSEQEKKETAQAYQVCLEHCQIMGEDEPYRSKVEQISAKMKEKDCCHPIFNTFSRTLYHYLRDVDLLSRSRQQFEQELHTHGRAMGEAIEEVLHRNRGTMNVDSQLEEQFAPLQQTWLNLFHHFYRKLSPYGAELIEVEVGWVCRRLVELLGECWGRESWLQGSRMQLDRKYFFTHRTQMELRQLVNTSPNWQLFKIVNVADILEDIYRQLDHNYHRHSPSAQISDTLKVAMVHEHLQQVQKAGQENNLAALQATRMHLFLLNVSTLYGKVLNRPEEEQQMDEDAVLHGLLVLQNQLKTLEPQFPHRDSQQEILAEKTAQLKKSLQDLPLSVASRNPVMPFRALLRYHEVGRELIKVHQVREKSALEWGILFAGVQELDEGRRVAESQFEAYENIVVKKKKSLTMYLQATRVKKKPLFEDIDSQINVIQKNFTSNDESIPMSRALDSLCRQFVR